MWSNVTLSESGMTRSGTVGIPKLPYLRSCIFILCNYEVHEEGAVLLMRNLVELFYTIGCSMLSQIHHCLSASPSPIVVHACHWQHYLIDVKIEHLRTAARLNLSTPLSQGRLMDGYRMWLPSSHEAFNQVLVIAVDLLDLVGWNVEEVPP